CRIAKQFFPSLCLASGVTSHELKRWQPRHDIPSMRNLRRKDRAASVLRLPTLDPIAIDPGQRMKSSFRRHRYEMEVVPRLDTSELSAHTSPAFCPTDVRAILWSRSEE